MVNAYSVILLFMSGASKQTINSALRKLETEDIVYLKSFEGERKKSALPKKADSSPIIRLLN